MAAFFKPNLDKNGRLVRALIGAVFVVLGAVAFFYEPWVATALFALGAFAFFESLRGWCPLRACGFKTKF